MKTTRSDTEGIRATEEGSWLEVVRRQVNSLKFGVVQIVVHGSHVVQVERTEKVRLTNPIAVSPEAD